MVQDDIKAFMAFMFNVYIISNVRHDYFYNFNRKGGKRMSMIFKIENNDKTLSVKLRMDGDDLDIVVTDLEGKDFTIAYLNKAGLIIPRSMGSSGIELDGAGRIVHRDD